MSKCIKLAVFTFFTAFVFGLLSCGDSHAYDIPTPEQYEKYLGEKADAESLKLKEHLSKMPRDKKQRLISYFFEPDKIKHIYNTEIAPNSKKILYNGDVTIESKSSISEEIVEEQQAIPNKKIGLTSLFIGNVFAAPVVKEYTATDVKKITFLGLSIKYTVSIKYRVVNGRVKKIFSGFATAEKFLAPNPIKRISFSKFITQSNNMAHGHAIWEVSLPILKNKLVDLSPVTAMKHHEVHGSSNGRVTWSFWQ